MNSNREDYLKVIYEEGGLHTVVSNKLISERLNIKAGSVTEMLVKLNDAQLIEYIPYKGSKLTKQGLQICMVVCRSHRVWEVFLTKCLGYSWREAHERAHIMEHVTDDMMLERLDEFLNFPEVCPHGEYIPRNNVTELKNNKIYRLCDLEEHKIARISGILEEGDLLDYAEEQGVKIGVRVEILSKAKYEGPITLVQGDRNITISHKAATQIYVDRK